MQVLNLCVRNFVHCRSVLTKHRLKAVWLNVCFSSCTYARAYNSLKKFNYLTILSNYSYGKFAFDNLNNLSKDVLLFSYEKSKLLKFMTTMGVVQLVVWIYMGSNLYSNLRDVKATSSPPPESSVSKYPIWRRINLGEKKYRVIALVSCMTIGLSTAFITYALPMRIVQKLILCKGGKTSRVITYGPFGRTKSFDAPLSHFSCQHTRESKASYISLKVKGHWFYYLLDSRGLYHNPELFDCTVGAARAKFH